MITLKRSIALILCICVFYSVLPTSINASNPINADLNYTVSRGLGDNGSIEYLGDTIYKYTGEVLSFEFEAYYISDYALSENILILKTNIPSIVSATINMTDDTITYVVEHGNEVKEYTSSISFEKDTFVYTTLSMEDEFDLCVELARNITWFTAYSEKNANPEIIVQDVYEKKEEISLANVSNITYTGEDAGIVEQCVDAYFCEKYLTTVGCYSGKIIDRKDNLYGAYAIETYYDDYYEKYISLIALWRMSYSILDKTDPDSTDDLTPYLAEGEIWKEHNWFIEYDEAANIADVSTADNNYSYIMTKNFDSMFRIYDDNQAYISSYHIGSDAGGGGSLSGNPSTLVLDKIFGERLEWYSYFNTVYIIIRDALDILTNIQYSKYDEEYEVENNSNIGYTRSIAACYDKVLHKKYSSLFTQATIENPDGNSGSMLYQVEFDVGCINGNSDTHHVVISHSETIG